jgi:hypothetical protein
MLVQSATRVERDVFLKRLKEQWGLMWRERFDDRVRAEGVSIQDYPMVFAVRGQVIFASRDAKTQCFSDVLASYMSQGLVYSPELHVGGWSKFIRTELKLAAHSRARSFAADKPKNEKEKQHLKKGGRGWLHK